MKKIFFIAAILSLFTGKLFSQCMTYPVSVPERVAGSQIIIEGKIISQSSFWNNTQDFIYTSNVIDVYKIFKGSITTSQIEIITEGGTVGNTMIKAEPALEFRINDVGVFFGIVSQQINPNSALPQAVQYEGYAANQSF